MPELTRFLGIIITMYFDEHEPPRFHVRYNEYLGVVSAMMKNSGPGLGKQKY